MVMELSLQCQLIDNNDGIIAYGMIYFLYRTINEWEEIFMRMSKEQMKSKLDTWLKHVVAGDSKFFFECNAYTGLHKEVFVEELKWLFEDPQDAVTESHNPYRREVFFYPDGTAHRFIRVYDEGVKRITLEDFNSGNMRVSNPCSLLGHNVGLSIWDNVDILEDHERNEIIQKATIWRENARKWGVLRS